MKNIFSLGLLFLLTSLVLSCGGESRKIPSPTQNPRDSIETSVATQRSIPAPTATSDNGEQTIDVSGKGCPANIAKVTSKDLAEAVINTTCGIAQKLEDPGGKNPEGVIRFTSLKAKFSPAGTDGVIHVTFSFEDCADCPRDFEWGWTFLKNPLGEWQAPEITSYSLGPTETRNSYAAKEARGAAKTAQAESVIFSEVKIQVLTTSSVLEYGSGLRNIQLRVDGAPTRIYLLGRLEDGRAVEFGNDLTKGIQLNATADYHFATNESQTDSANLPVQIVAYAYAVGENRSDWIYLNK